MRSQESTSGSPNPVRFVVAYIPARRAANVESHRRASVRLSNRSVCPQPQSFVRRAAPFVAFLLFAIGWRGIFSGKEADIEDTGRLAVRQGDTILLAPVSSIHWFSAEDKYIVLHTFDQEYLFDGALKDLEAQLDPDRFCRIHRSVIVALDKIAKIVRLLGGRYAAKMADRKSASLAIGRAYLPLVRERFRF